MWIYDTFNTYSIPLPLDLQFLLLLHHCWVIVKVLETESSSVTVRSRSEDDRLLSQAAGNENSLCWGFFFHPTFPPPCSLSFVFLSWCTFQDPYLSYPTTFYDQDGHGTYWTSSGRGQTKDDQRSCKEIPGNSLYLSVNLWSQTKFSVNDVNHNLF